MIPPAASSWNVSCGRAVQLKICMGSAVNSSIGLSGKKATNVRAPIMIRGAVSPIARDSARMIPVKMPGSAEGRTWARTTCQRVAPSAKAANRKEFGTDRIASFAAIIITGSMSKDMVKAPAMTLRPRPKNRTKMASPRIPKTMEGTPARLAILISMK